MINHREYRATVRDVCDRFYMQIRNYDSSDESWAEIVRMAGECGKRNGDSRLGKDLILAVLDELERSQIGDKEEEVKVCSVCGRRIQGELVRARTPKGKRLYMHPECVNADKI